MYSQGPAIEFYDNIKNEDKYVVTVGYKSYANYFYGQTKNLTPSDSLFHVKARVYNEMIEKNSVDRLTTEQLKLFDQKIYKLESILDADSHISMYRNLAEFHYSPFSNKDKLFLDKEVWSSDLSFFYKL